MGRNHIICVISFRGLQRGTRALYLNKLGLYERIELELGVAKLLENRIGAGCCQAA